MLVNGYLKYLEGMRDKVVALFQNPVPSMSERRKGSPPVISSSPLDADL